MYHRYALALGVSLWTCGALAQAAPSSTATPPGAAASPSVEANRDSKAAATTAPSTTPATPGHAASPSVEANQQMNAPSTSTTPNSSAVGPGAGASPSVAHNAGAASDAPH
jgi:hypothetical protein